MKKFLLAGIAILCASTVQAGDEIPYVSIKANYSNATMDLKETGYKDVAKDDSTIGASVAVGAKIQDVRVEAELNLNANLSFYDDIDIENNSLFINAYYDINTGTEFTPYIGAGVGVSAIRPAAGGADVDFTHAWQVGAGVAYAFDEKISMDMGYRYVDSGDWTIENPGDKSTLDIASHNVYVGARYSF